MILVYHSDHFKSHGYSCPVFVLFSQFIILFHIFRNYTQVSIDIFKHYFRITFLRFVLFLQMCYTFSQCFARPFHTQGAYQYENTQSAVQTFYRLSWHGLLILFSFAIFFYVFASGQLKKSQISAMSTLNSTFQSQVDSAIQNLDTVSVNINYSNMSKSVLDQKFDLNISDEMLSAMSDLFISLSGTELKADQVNLYDFSGYVLQAGLSTMVKKSDDSHNEWIQKAREANGKKVLTAPYSTYVYSKSARYPQWFISLYRSFTNQYGRGVGVIETAKQCKSIFKSIISYEKKITEMLPVSMFSMSPAILSILMISQPTNTN